MHLNKETSFWRNWTWFIEIQLFSNYAPKCYVEQEVEQDPWSLDAGGGDEAGGDKGEELDLARMRYGWGRGRK